MRFLYFAFTTALLFAQTPKRNPNGSDLPNGWKITPAGKNVTTADYILNVTNTPDGRNVVALHSGYNPHGLVLFDPRNVEITQKVGMKSSWFGLAWAPDGKRL